VNAAPLARDRAKGTGLALVANQYRWCSASWFEGVASPAMVRSIYAFKTDTLSIGDDFAPIVDS
jgi:hypothetical protein